jgi:hypothetical protein
VKKKCNIGGIEVYADVTRRRFTPELVADVEGNIPWALIMLEARWCRRIGSASWSARCRLSCWQVSRAVTDLQGPPSERTPEEKLWDLKTRAQQYARDRGSCDDTRISYLEFVESEAEADLTLARMIAG